MKVVVSGPNDASLNGWILIILEIVVSDKVISPISIVFVYAESSLTSIWMSVFESGDVHVSREIGPRVMDSN